MNFSGRIQKSILGITWTCSDIPVQHSIFMILDYLMRHREISAQYISAKEFERISLESFIEGFKGIRQC